MAEGFEVYHVTQQSRRDNLRFVQDLQLQNRATTSSLYDPSSYLLPCANPHLTTTIGVIKQESTMSLMGFGATAATSGIINVSSDNNSNSSSFLDPQASLHNLQDLNHHHTTATNNHQQSFLYSHHPQSFRLFDHHHHHQEPFNSGGGAEPLALSLSSHNTHNTNHPLELNLQRHDLQPHSIYGGGGGDYCRSMVPLGPFTGYASILKGSKFLKPAQQLLEEICDVGCGIYAEKFSVDSSLMDSSPMECLSKINAFVNVDDPNNNGGDKRKKSRLISMLDEVYKRYKQYYQQIQAVVASFETVAGLSNAAPFASLDLKVLSKHFRCLKNAITDQLQFAPKHHMNSNRSKEDITPAGSDRELYGQRLISSAMVEHHPPVWRPQRGLPERAVTVLRAWLFDHFLHPYPTDTDKLMLAKQTGLSRNQVSNWFINARVRLWKPMVEEIHTLETRQVAKTSGKDDANMTSDNLPPQSTLLPGNPPFSPQRIQLDPPSKRTRSDNLMTGNGHEEPMTLLYDNTLPRGNNVSLTLGLHQNNGPVGMSDHLPLNAARRFGLDMSSSESSNVFSSFDSQNRPFGREVIGGQLLHDFVG